MKFVRKTNPEKPIDHSGATTFGIMTLSIMTFSIMILSIV